MAILYNEVKAGKLYFLFFRSRRGAGGASGNRHRRPDPHVQSADPEREMEKLRAIRGIGGWTAQYIAMRTIGWPDAFLETDAEVKHALPGKSAKELLALAERWRPWRSYAVLNLWFKEDSRNAIYKHVSLPGGGNSFGLR